MAERRVPGSRPILPRVAELDVMLGVPGVSAELDLVVGRAVGKAMATEDRVKRWREAGSPTNRRINLSGTVTAAQAGLSTATAFFPFEISPQTGRMWSVRKVALMAGSPPVTNQPFASAISNLNAVLYVTQGGVAAAAGTGPPVQDADQTSFTLPNTQFYSTHQLWIRGGEWLVVGVQGTAVVQGFQVWGHARVIEIDDDPRYLLDL